MEIVRYPLFVAGVGFFIYGLYGLGRSLRLRLVYELSHGVVVSYVRHAEHLRFAPRVEFTGADGRQHTFLSEVYGSQDIPIGGRVHVRYLPADPKRAEIARFSTLWLFPLLWLGFGVAFLLASILTPKGTLLSGDS
jgi:hypothetical protein